jgi:5-methylcytosine-specific restriction protein A
MQDAGGLCVRCAERGRYVRATVVHHIQPVEDRPDLRLEPGNLMPLCRDCHEREHGRKSDARQGARVMRLKRPG